MDSIYLVAYTTILIFTILIPSFLLGRIWFAVSPFVINYYRSEKASWYNSWNTDRFLIVVSGVAISVVLSFFWGVKILRQIREVELDFVEVFFYIVIQIIILVLLEAKMDHPGKPLKAFREFQRKRYDERFVFLEKQNAADTVTHHAAELKKEIQHTKESLAGEIQIHKDISTEIHLLADENNRLLKTSDFPFEFRNTTHLNISNLMTEYFISEESRQPLEDFLLRKRKNGKIVFTKIARNGVSIQPILDFFSRYTDLIEKCKAEKYSQAETAKIINETASALTRKGELENQPINSKNLSKYLS